MCKVRARPRVPGQPGAADALYNLVIVIHTFTPSQVRALRVVSVGVSSQRGDFHESEKQSAPSPSQLQSVQRSLLPRLLHRPAVAAVVDMAAAADTAVDLEADTVVGLAAAAFVAAGLGAAVNSAVLQSAVSAVARSAVSAAGLVDSVGAALGGGFRGARFGGFRGPRREAFASPAFGAGAFPLRQV